MEGKYTFVYKDETYDVLLVRDVKLHSRAKLECSDGQLRVRMSRFFPEKQLVSFLEKHHLAMVNMVKRHPKDNQDVIYIMGTPYQIIYEEGGYKIGNIMTYQTLDERDKKLLRMLKDYALPRFKEWERIMHITSPYRLSFRKMSSRYGSNSRKTHHITLNTNLVHYSKPIIDSVIIHELAHDRHFDHSSAFYDELLTYCPDYRLLKKKLNRGEFQ